MNPTWLYVGALYVGATELARRLGANLPRRMALLFYALVLVFFFRPMTGPWTDVATDVLQLLPPWSASAPSGLDKYGVSNLQQGDVVMQLVPWAHQVREAWRSGSVPIWNELNGAGYPLISNGQGGALSPLRLLALPLSLAHSITAEAAFKVLLALTFAFLYARRRGLPELPAAIVAISYGFGTFLIVWIHFAQATVAAFLPAVLFVIDRLAENTTAGRLVSAALVVPAVLFSGHPDTASQMALFAGAYAIWIAPRRIGVIALSGVIGVLLSLPFIVPFLEAMPHGFRYGTIEEAPRLAIPFSDFPSLRLLVLPRFFGTLPHEAPWGNAHAESISGFAGILGIAGFFLLVIELVRFRRWRSHETFYVFSGAALFLVLANVAPVVRLLHFVLPFGSHARMRFLFTWVMAFAAGVLVDRMLRGDRKRVVGAIAATIALAALLFTRMPPPSPELWELALQGAMLSLVIAIAVVIFVLFRRRFAGAMIILGAITIELWLVTWQWNPVFPVATLYPRTPLIDAVARVHRPGRDRIVGIGSPLFPNTNVPFGFEDVRILDAMAPWRYARLLNLIMPSFDLNEYYVKWQEPENPLLDYLNVRWVMTEPGRDLPDGEKFAALYRGADGSLFENRAVLPRFFPVRNVIVVAERETFLERIRSHTDWKATAIVQSMPDLSEEQRNDLLAPRPAGAAEPSVKITATTPRRYEMHIDAPRHALIVSSIGWWKWWRAETADGRALRTFRVNEAFLGILAPPGRSTIIVHYVPTTLYIAFGISAVTLGLLLFVLVRASRVEPQTVP